MRTIVTEDKKSNATQPDSTTEFQKVSILFFCELKDSLSIPPVKYHMEDRQEYYSIGGGKALLCSRGFLQPVYIYILPPPTIILYIYI